VRAAIFIAAVAVLLAVLPGPAALAQCGWECLDTPTPTATGTPAPLPTPEPTPTGPYEMPEATDLELPNYPLPTSIPALQWPEAPSPLLATPLATPELAPLAIDTPVPATITAITATLLITYTEPATLSTDGQITGSAAYTAIVGAVGGIQGIITDAISFTTWITGSAAALQGTDTFTVATAPADYAPTLPRPMANVGYTFEEISSPDGTIRPTMSSMGAFVGYMLAQPVQLARGLWGIASALGPFALFLGWLLLMFGISLAVAAIRLAIEIVGTVIDLIVRAIDIVWP